MLATRSPTPMRTTEPVSLKVSDSNMSCDCAILKGLCSVNVAGFVRFSQF